MTLKSALRVTRSLEVIGILFESLGMVSSSNSMVLSSILIVSFPGRRDILVDENRHFLYPLHSTPPSGPRQNIAITFGVEKFEWRGNPTVKRLDGWLCLAVSKRYRRVTDRRISCDIRVIQQVSSRFFKKYINKTNNYITHMHIKVGLPDLPYFPGAPVFRPLSPVSRTEAKISRIWRGIV